MQIPAMNPDAIYNELVMIQFLLSIIAFASLKIAGMRPRAATAVALGVPFVIFVILNIDRWLK